jgi:ribonuclease Z
MSAVVRCFIEGINKQVTRRRVACGLCNVYMEVLMISRKDFLKGALLGAGTTVALAGCVKVTSGDLSYMIKPLEGMTVRLLPEFHDEMKVILLGTGIPLCGVERSKPANVVMAGNKFFIVDCGAGVANRLFMAGIPPSRISDILITHHHSDHNSGFTNLLLSGWVGGPEPSREIPVQVYGPSNSSDIIGKFMDAMQWDIEIRARHAGDSLKGMEVHIHEKNEGVIYDNDGIKITAFTVDHGIVKPALGFRFEYRNRVIVISGDTLPCENMVKHSEGADVLIHEAYSRDWIEAGLKRFPHMTKRAMAIMNYHSSTLEAAEIAKKARVKHLVFTHMMPSPAPVWHFERHWASSVGDIFDGKVTVGRDLMMF